MKNLFRIGRWTKAWDRFTKTNRYQFDIRIQAEFITVPTETEEAVQYYAYRTVETVWAELYGEIHEELMALSQPGDAFEQRARAKALAEKIHRLRLPPCEQRVVEFIEVGRSDGAIRRLIDPR